MSAAIHCHACNRLAVVTVDEPTPQGWHGDTGTNGIMTWSCDECVAARPVDTDPSIFTFDVDSLE